MNSFLDFKSIRTKLILIALSLLIVPLFTLGTIIFYKAKGTLDEQGVKGLASSVEMTIEMIDALNDQVETAGLSLEEAQEKVKVAILGEMDESGNRPINKNIDIGENGYLFILDQSGREIAHPTSEGTDHWDLEDSKGNKFVQEMIEKANNGGGVTRYEWHLPNDESKVEEKIVYSKADNHWGWTINASAYAADYHAAAYDIMILICIVTLSSIAIGIIFAILLARRITRPINAVVTQLQTIAEGDLSLEKLTIDSKDETGQLAQALNNMQDGLRNIVGNLHTASVNMASQSEELTQAAHEVTEGAEQVSSTMQELASGAEVQANRSSDISNMMGSFVSQIESMYENGENIQQSSSQVIQLTDEGRQLMNTSTEQMHKIDDIVHEAVNKVEGLDRHSQEISELVLMIQDIAEQTNLLALNAAIEAARAGEHGQGFAVVADEVRKLAEESSSSVVHITNIVDRIQEESSNVASSLRAGYSEVEQGTTHILTTEKTLTEINTAVNDMVSRISEIVNNLNTIVDDSQQMNDHIEDIAAVSEESAAGIEETTATTQQAGSTMHEVAMSSEQLSKLAEDLSSLVEQFKI
ncbi:MAG TPA: methyl-accepting chemotaxis protein [Pseudogracilibacillus sp.]|nr:methyl-accepting chemotaxis protein [Pseudogracilibacillus sp.]